MRQSKPSSNVTVSVTMPGELRDEILKLAGEGERSFSNQVTVILKKQIEAFDYKTAWERRGKALAMPCPHCGKTSDRIHAVQEAQP